MPGASSPRAARFLRAVLCAVGLLSAASGARAQQVQSAVVPQNITVGDVFHAAVRIDLPAGANVLAPDSLALPADLERAGAMQVRIDSAGGVRRATITYPISAWRPGEFELAPITVQVASDGGVRTLQVNVPPFSVSSVLPSDTAGIQPQPARDVLGANRLWWPIILALLLAAIVAVLLYVWWRRRRGDAVEAAPMPLVLPRTAALERLAALERAGHIERGDMKPYYEELTEILRRYAATVRPGWSVDLTTTELAARAGNDVEAAELLRILAGADLIKFARGRAAQQEARTDLTAARAWVQRVEAPPTEPAQPAPGSQERRVA